MNSYKSVFNTGDLQNNRNQFEIPKPQPISTNSVVSTTAISQPPNPIDGELVLKFLDAISKDPVNEHKSSQEKFDLAVEMVKSLHYIG